MPIRPLGNRVVVKRLNPESRTASGLHLPNPEKNNRAKIVAVGPGLPNKDGEPTGLNVTVGDVVLLGKYSGQEISVNGDDCIIIKESEILGVIE